MAWGMEVLETTIDGGYDEARVQCRGTLGAHLHDSDALIRALNIEGPGSAHSTIRKVHRIELDEKGAYDLASSEWVLYFEY